MRIDPALHGGPLVSPQPRELAQVDPGQVRVRVSVPVGYELNIRGSRLTLALARGTGNRNVENGAFPASTVPRTPLSGALRR